MPAVDPNQKVVLTLANLQIVLNYMATRPYSEVFQVIEVLKQSKTLEATVAEQTPEVTEVPQQQGA